MKTTLLYGFFLAAAGLLLQVLATLTGLYADAQKLPKGQMIVGVLGLIIGIVLLIIGLRACRAQGSADGGYSYGKAVGDGALITLWNTIFGAVFTALFFTVINPDLRDLMRQAQLDKISAAGQDPDKAEGMVRMMTSLPILVLFGIIGTAFFGMILVLIIAAFVRREPARVPPQAPPVAA